ncbi:hypothetical protein [Streptomyces sp. NPDC060198]|uniref:hypothetical protein n=1 Tax=Streptomyces sp. NPDC060198 TaxID=3347070 RepID=UPI003666B392
MVSEGRPDSVEPLPYREVTEDHYAQDYTGDLRILAVDDESAVLAGRCPRCGCAFTYLHTRRTFRSARLPRGPQIPVMCTCTTGHPLRPSGEEGCGAFWNVVVERT